MNPLLTVLTCLGGGLVLPAEAQKCEEKRYEAQAYSWINDDSDSIGQTYNRCVLNWAADDRIAKARQAYWLLIGDTQQYDKFFILEIASESMATHSGYFVGVKGSEYRFVVREPHSIDFGNLQDAEEKATVDALYTAAKASFGSGSTFEAVPKGGMSHPMCSFFSYGTASGSAAFFGTTGVGYLIQSDMEVEYSVGDLNPRQKVLYDFFTLLKSE